MKFKSKKFKRTELIEKWENYHIRIHRKFLFFPRTFSDKEPARVFEFAYIVEGPTKVKDIWKWVETRFATKEEYTRYKEIIDKGETLIEDPYSNEIFSSSLQHDLPKRYLPSRIGF